MDDQKVNIDYKKYLAPTFLFLFALFHYSTFQKYSIFNIYQARDIQRTLELINGQWIWYGPDLSGGGHTPGPFYYYLLAIPLSIFGTWQSVLWLQHILVSGAITLFYCFIKNKYDSVAAIVFYFLFLSSTIFEIIMFQFWNPSYLPFFQVLVIILFFDYKNISQKKLTLGGIIIGLTTQIHYQQLIFLAGIIVTLFRDKSKNLKDRLLNIATVSIFTLLPCIPYLVMTSSKNGTYHELSAGIESLSRLFIPLLHFNFLLNGFLTFFYKHLILEFAFLLLIFIWIFWLKSEFSIQKKMTSKNKFLTTTLIISSLFLIPNIYAPFYLRYAMPFFLLFYLISSSLLSRILNFYPRIQTWGSILFISAVALSNIITRDNPFRFSNLLLIPLSLLISYFIFNNKNRKLTFFLFLPLLFETQTKHLANKSHDLGKKYDLAQILVEETGLPWEYLREKTYILGKLPEDDFSILYKQAYHENKNRITPQDFDGILINFKTKKQNSLFFKKMDYPKMHWESFKDKLPIELYSMGTNEDLICKITKNKKNYEICFYELVNSQFNYKWNNLGYPYQFNQPVSDFVKGKIGSKKTDNGNWIFYFSDCSKKDRSCIFYVILKPLENGFAEVTVLGDPISVPEAIANPTWAVSLKNLSIKMTCNGKESIHRIVSLIGPSIRGPNYDKPSFVGPYKTVVPFDCLDPSEIAITSNKFISLTMTKRIPDRSLSIIWKENQEPSPISYEE